MVQKYYIKKETNFTMVDDHKENNEVLTDAEAELYDRQLRLWGSEAQSR